MGLEENEYYWLLKEYYWDGRNSRGMYDSFFGTDSLIPGLGMMANSHTGLVNILIAGPPSVLSGKTGSYSAYHDFRHIASKDIPKGSELFVQYGDEWFEGREWKFGPIPLSDDFEQADIILDKFNNLLFSKQRKGDENTKKKDMVWDFIRNKLTTNQRMKMALPPEWNNKQKSAAQMSVPHFAQRSEEWLQEHGYCIDHIRPATSTITNAGTGAFATRFLPKDTIITPAPLVQMHRYHAQMYFKQDYGETIHLVGTQLLQNYCFGHRKSSLLLFPYAPIVNFINHHSDKVNARLQWSTSSSNTILKTQDWLQKSVHEVLTQDYPVLMLEFVATRDIQEGEEIFIHYGDHWQQSWEQHSRSWNKPATYVDAEEFNTNTHQIIKTIDEQKLSAEHYPDNVITICYFPKYNWDEFLDYENKNNMPSEMEWEGSAHDSNWMRYMDNTKSCDILERFDQSLTYHVRFWLYDDDDRNEDDSFILKNIPRYAIQFVNKPYSSDQYFKGSFRHEIEIPDDIFPTSWMDLVSPENEDIENNVEGSSMSVIDWTKFSTNGRRGRFLCRIPNHVLSNDNLSENGQRVWSSDHSYLYGHPQRTCTVLSSRTEDPELYNSIIPPSMTYSVKIMDSSETILIDEVPHDAIEYNGEQ